MSAHHLVDVRYPPGLVGAEMTVTLQQALLEALSAKDPADAVTAARLVVESNPDAFRDDEILTRILAWTHEYGASLKPPGPDTYGEGMRDAKDQVAAILRSLP